MDVKCLVPKKYRLNIIINDSVKFQKEFLKGNYYSLIEYYMAKTRKHITH